MARKYFSKEDGDLETRSLTTSRNRSYSDIDLTFTKKPSGDVYKKVDGAAVKQAVKNLLLTTPGEKPFNPYFGAGLNSLLFELVDDEDTNVLLTEYISNAIENFEPRARLISVTPNVQPDNNTARVRVEFQVVNTSETVVFETTIIRLR
jgi:phage baseplate assembly protein W